MRAPSSAIGIVRRARRPDGWIATGPRPAARRDDLALWPGPGEDLCWLAGDWRILQRHDGHRWSLDDLLTAWFAALELSELPARRGRSPARPRPVRFVDLGCGIGSVLLLLAWKLPGARGIGVEAQAVSVDLARRSIARNGAEERCQVRRGDLRDPVAIPEGPVFDLVTGTPPYLPRGTGTESPKPQRAPARIELRGGIEDYCATAARLLAPGASFVGCEAAGRRERLERAARAAGLGIARQRDVVPRAGKLPLFTLFALRRPGHTASSASAGEPRAEIEPPLVVRDARGRRTAEYRAVREAMGMPP